MVLEVAKMREDSKMDGVKAQGEHEIFEICLVRAPSPREYQALFGFLPLSIFCHDMPRVASKRTHLRHILPNGALGVPSHINHGYLMSGDTIICTGFAKMQTRLVELISIRQANKAFKC